ncbi:DUF4817 domain-containing protein [Trichonephila clavipes]|nr:DUF4817 domain-containing protein [Trichonephila clavipes]
MKEFYRMKRIRRGPMSPYALLKMIQKFETTRQLGILPGRGRNQILSFNVENVTTAVVEAAIRRRSVEDKIIWNPELFRHRKTVALYAEEFSKPTTSTMIISIG